MKEPLLAELKTHLEFLGYEVSVDKDGDIQALHVRHFNSTVIEYQSGVLFVVAFGGMEVEESKAVEVLREINNFNAASALTMGYLNKTQSVIITAWYPLPYNKACFSTFIEQFHREQTKFSVTKILDLTKPKVEGAAPAEPSDQVSSAKVD